MGKDFREFIKEWYAKTSAPFQPAEPEKSFPQTSAPTFATWVPSDIRVLSSKPIEGVKTLSFPSKNSIVVCRIGEDDSSGYINYTLEELKSHENEIHFVSIKTDLSNLDAAIAEIARLDSDIVFIPHKDDTRSFVAAARGRVLEKLSEMADESGRSKTVVFYETAGMVRQYNLIWQVQEQYMEKKRQAMLQYPSQMKRLPYNVATEYAMKANIRKARAEISDDIKGEYAELYQFVTIKGGEIQASPTDKYYFMGEGKVNGCERFGDITNSLIIKLAPHYDDDEIANGGLSAKLSETNDLIVVDMTTGHKAEIPGVTSIEEKIRIREGEAGKASRVIGDKENVFLRLPFYDHTDPNTNQRIISKAEKDVVYKLVHDRYVALKEKNPSGKFVMMMPQEKDAHPDHVATNHIGLDAAKRLSREEGAEIIVLFYIAPWAGEANAYAYVPNEDVKKMAQSAPNSGKEALEAMLYSGTAAAIVATELTTTGGFGAKALTPTEIGGEYAERLNITRISPSPSPKSVATSVQTEELLSRITVTDTEDQMGEAAAKAILKDLSSVARIVSKKSLRSAEMVQLFIETASQIMTAADFSGTIAFYRNSDTGTVENDVPPFEDQLREIVIKRILLENPKLETQCAAFRQRAIDAYSDAKRLKFEPYPEKFLNKAAIWLAPFEGDFAITQKDIDEVVSKLVVNENFLRVVNQIRSVKGLDSQDILQVTIASGTLTDIIRSFIESNKDNFPNIEFTYQAIPELNLERKSSDTPIFKSTKVEVGELAWGGVAAYPSECFVIGDDPMIKFKGSNGETFGDRLLNARTYDRTNVDTSIRAIVARAMGKPEVTSKIVDIAAQISEDLPVRAKVFAANLTKILVDHPDQLFFIGIETDIGETQKAQIMPICKAIDQIENMTDSTGKRLFPNLMVRRARSGELVTMVSDLNREGKLNLNNAFIGARKVSVDNKAYDSIKGEGRVWISAIDDSKPGDYLPVFEAITLNMMAYLNASEAAIKSFYDAISDKPIDPGVLQDMIRNRIIYILPRATKFDTKQLRQLYELAQQVYTAA